MGLVTAELIEERLVTSMGARSFALPILRCPPVQFREVLFSGLRVQLLGALGTTIKKASGAGLPIKVQPNQVVCVGAELLRQLPEHTFDDPGPLLSKSDDFGVHDLLRTPDVEAAWFPIEGVQVNQGIAEVATQPSSQMCFS